MMWPSRADECVLLFCGTCTCTHWVSVPGTVCIPGGSETDKRMPQLSTSVSLLVYWFLMEQIQNNNNILRRIQF